MIKIVKNKVFDGLRTYEPGDTIPGLPENDEKQLVADGVAEYVNDEHEESLEDDIDVNEEDEDTDGTNNENQTHDNPELVINPNEFIIDSNAKTTRKKGK